MSCMEKVILIDKSDGSRLYELADDFRELKAILDSLTKDPSVEFLRVINSEVSPVRIWSNPNSSPEQ